MKQTVFDIIQERIECISVEAVSTFKARVVTDQAETMYRMGFTSSASVVQGREKVNQKESLRARMIQYFGRKVLYVSELKKFEKRFNLVTHTASRFMDHIPMANQDEIIEYMEHVKKEHLNQGRIETELYHIPLGDPFLVTAPAECFRRPFNPGEMTPEEIEKWLEDDPIVWKRIWQFQPTATQYDRKNQPTEMVAMITAWGLEEVLINNN